MGQVTETRFPGVIQRHEIVLIDNRSRTNGSHSIKMHRTVVEEGGEEKTKFVVYNRSRGRKVNIDWVKLLQSELDPSDLCRRFGIFAFSSSPSEVCASCG